MPLSAFVRPELALAIWAVMLSAEVPVACRIISTPPPVEKIPEPEIVLGVPTEPVVLRMPPLETVNVVPAVMVAAPPVSVRELIAIFAPATVVTPVVERTLVPAVRRLVTPSVAKFKARNPLVMS